MQRVLPKPYAERDVADVELYVRDAVHGLGDVRGDERDRLVARGIFVVRRIAQALPPEVSLEADVERASAGRAHGLPVTEAPRPPARAQQRRVTLPQRSAGAKAGGRAVAEALRGAAGRAQQVAAPL